MGKISRIFSFLVDDEYLLAKISASEEIDTLRLYEHLRGMGYWISLGGLHLRINRLERQMLVTTRLADPTPERGNRPKRYVKVSDFAR